MQIFALAIGGLPAGFSFDGSSASSKQDDQCKGAKANPGTEDFITIPQASEREENEHFLSHVGIEGAFELFLSVGTCKGAEGSQSRFCGSNLNFAPGVRHRKNITCKPRYFYAKCFPF